MIRRFIDISPDSPFPLISEAIAGDVLFYDSQSGSHGIIPYDSVDVVKYPSSRYIPVAVVVVPSAHDAYGTGEVGCVGLRALDGTSEGGHDSRYASARWGDDTINISGIVDKEGIPVIGRNSSFISFSYCSGISNGFSIPAQSQYGSENEYGLDPGTYLNSLWNYWAPSPYSTSGVNGKNDIYFNTSRTECGDNLLADMGGKENTQAVLRTSVPNGSLFDRLRKFNPSGLGTTSSDWYIPSLGECGYISARVDDIKNSVSLLNSLYSANAIFLSRIWSSSEVNTQLACYSVTDTGIIGCENKYDEDEYCIPFIRFRLIV